MVPCSYGSLLTGSLVPQATLFPLQLEKGEDIEPWSFWEKVSILRMFTQHAAYESVNTAVWRLAGNASTPHLYLAVTDNTVAAQVDSLAKLAETAAVSSEAKRIKRHLAYQC